MLHSLLRFLRLDPEQTFRPRTLKTRGLEVKKTICCFCSCGCGMNAFIQEGRLVALEGDPGNPINEGTLCSKGAAAAGLHHSPERLTAPLRRRPGARDFEVLSWDAALDAVTRRLFDVRRRTWDAAGRRSDAIGFLGGAVNTNEEAYSYRKLAALMGLVYVEHQARI